MHGIAGVIESEAMKYLDFDAKAQSAAVDHARRMIDKAVFDIPVQ